MKQSIVIVVYPHILLTALLLKQIKTVLLLIFNGLNKRRDAHDQRYTLHYSGQPENRPSPPGGNAGFGFRRKAQPFGVVDRVTITSEAIEKYRRLRAALEAQPPALNHPRSQFYIMAVGSGRMVGRLVGQWATLSGNNCRIIE
jgi:hypothetical protein